MIRLKEVAPGFWVATSSLYATTTTVVVGVGSQCLVIDPGVGVDELVDLSVDLKTLGLVPEAGFSTHPHWDHLLWSDALGKVPRYASDEAVRVAQREFDDLIGQAEAAVPGHSAALFARLTPLPCGAERIAWRGPQSIILTHAAHAPGHSALFFPDQGVLAAGDMLSDIEIPLLDLDQPLPLDDYRQALDRFSALDGVRWVIPGHGHVGDGQEFQRRLQQDYRYLDDLANGRESDDARLSDPWLQEESDKQRPYRR